MFPRASPAGRRREGPRCSVRSSQSPATDAAALACRPAWKGPSSTAALATGLQQVAQKPREETARKRFCACSGRSCWNPAASIPLDTPVSMQTLPGDPFRGKARITPAGLHTKPKPLPFTPGRDSRGPQSHSTESCRPGLRTTHEGFFRWILWPCL